MTDTKTDERIIRALEDMWAGVSVAHQKYAQAHPYDQRLVSDLDSHHIVTSFRTIRKLAEAIEIVREERAR